MVAVVVTMVTVAMVIIWCYRRLNSKHCSGTLKSEFGSIKQLHNTYFINQLTSMNITKTTKLLIT